MYGYIGAVSVRTHDGGASTQDGGRVRLRYVARARPVGRRALRWTALGSSAVEVVVKL
jgi:hypothetical protein